MKLELLALKWAVTEQFREYLLGNKFAIFTDNPLSYLQTVVRNDQRRFLRGGYIKYYSTKRIVELIIQV